MQKTFVLYLFIITNIFICVSCNSMPVKEQEKVVSLPDWEKKNIANPWFDNWGSLIVENQNNYFYATSKGIMRIDKQTGKETLIVEKESKEMQLCIGEKSLYYIVPEEKNLFRVDFSGRNSRKLLCGNDIKGAQLEYPDLLGMHIYKGQIYLLLGGYELCVFDEHNRTVKYIADDVQTGDNGFYKDYFYYGKSNESEIRRIDLNTFQTEVIKEQDDKMGSLIQVGVYKDDLYYYFKKDKMNKVYRHNGKNGFEKILEIEETEKLWNLEFVRGDEAGYFLYDTGKFVGEQVWLKRLNYFGTEKFRVPDDYVYSLGIFEGYFFYCSDKETTKVIKIDNSVRR